MTTHEPTASPSHGGASNAADRDVDWLMALLAQAGGMRDSPGPDGERVDLLEHALQCGYELQCSHPDDVELQVAGLVHDLGHQLVPGDDAGHGRAAADAVRPLFGGRVADLVELHVPAKRYLVTTDPAYHDVLSPVSVRTLGNQGGAMSPDEVAAFERHPHARAAVTLRRADEAAKTPGRPVPSLDDWHPILTDVTQRATAG